MKRFTIARSYPDMDNKILTLFIRFGKQDQIQHVSKPENATIYATREEAAAQCPRGYFVHPKPKAKKGFKPGPAEKAQRAKERKFKQRFDRGEV